MQFKNKISLVLAAALLAGLGGCVNMPTEKQSVVDQRPQISFRIAGDAKRLAGARVLVDELDMGELHQYLDGQSTLRILPGTHVVKVQSGPTVFLLERAYVGDGVVRPFVVNAN
jgi:hypothetical protein